MSLDLEPYRADLASITRQVVAVVLWGSHAKGEAHARSDVDLCVVAGSRDRTAMVRALGLVLETLQRTADVHVFEELPQHMQADVMEHHVVVIAHDRGALHEYWRPFMRIWRDQRLRHALA